MKTTKIEDVELVNANGSLCARLGDAKLSLGEDAFGEDAVRAQAARDVLTFAGIKPTAGNVHRMMGRIYEVMAY